MSRIWTGLLARRRPAHQAPSVHDAVELIALQAAYQRLEEQTGDAHNRVADLEATISEELARHQPQTVQAASNDTWTRCSHCWTSFPCRTRWTLAPALDVAVDLSVPA